MRIIIALLVGVGGAFSLTQLLAQPENKANPVRPVPTAQAKRPTQYLREAVLARRGNVVTVTANDSRPLLQALTTISQEYGWVVDYEDPRYTDDYELSEYAAPAWRAAHPNTRGSRIPSGGSFEFELDEGKVTDLMGQEAVLRKLVAAYNKTTNPGRFVVTDQGNGRFAIVGRNQRSGQDSGTILETTISIPQQRRSVYDTLKLIATEISKKSETKVALGMTPTSLLVNTEVEVGADSATGRALILQAVQGVQPRLNWTLMYEPNKDVFFLSFVVATQNIYDTYGRKTIMPLNSQFNRRSN